MSTDFSIKVEIGFEDNLTVALETVNWYDVTNYVRGSIIIKRGRQKENDRIEAGTMTLNLDNRDRRFDPQNIIGSYYPNILPMRRIRVTASQGAVVDARMFMGYIEEWQQGWNGPDATVQVTASDGLKILSNTELASSVYQLEVEKDTPVSWWRMGDVTKANNNVPAVMTDHMKHFDGTFETDTISLEVASLTYRDSDAAIGFNGAEADSPDKPNTTGGDRAAMLDLAGSIQSSATPWTIEGWLQVPVQWDSANTIDDIDEFAWVFSQDSGNGNVIALTISAPGQYPTVGNLIADPSFENVDFANTTFPSWAAYALPGDNTPSEWAAFHWEKSSTAHSANYSAKLVMGNPAPAATLVSRYASVTPGQLVDASLWHMADTGTGGGIWMYVWFSGPTGLVSTQLIGSGTPSVGSWTQLTGTSIAVPQGANSVQVLIRAGRNPVNSDAITEGAGAWYVDDVVLGRTADVDGGALVALKRNILSDGSELKAGGRSNSMVDNEFPHHFVVVNDPDDGDYPLRIYIDGEFDTVTLFDDAVTTRPGVIYMGGPPPGRPGLYLRGAIDEVAIYDKVLTQERISAHYLAGTLPWDADKTGARISRVLDSINWVDGSDIDEGNSVLAPAALQKSTALDYLQRVAETEAGSATLYVRGDGSVRFRDRHSIIGNSPSAVPQATYGDVYFGGASPYMQLSLRYDESRIFNFIECQRELGNLQKSEDADSQVTFLKRGLQLTNLMYRIDQDVKRLGDYVLDLYKMPQVRVESIVFRPQYNPALLFGPALQRDIGDRIRVQRQPPGGGAAIDFEAIIEEVEHEITGDFWTVRWWLSNATAGTGYLILNDVTFGKLDTDKLAF